MPRSHTRACAQAREAAAQAQEAAAQARKAAAQNKAITMHVFFCVVALNALFRTCGLMDKALTRRPHRPENWK